jgi:CHAT domain-containing protein
LPGVKPPASPVPPTRRPRPARHRERSRLGVPKGLAALAALAALLGARCAHRPAPDVVGLPTRNVLAAALQLPRPGGGRLSEVAWLSEPPPGRPLSGTRSPGQAAQARALARRVMSAATQETPTVDGERAIIALAAGRIDDAGLLLATAAALEPRQGWPLSDLSAVHLELARARHDAHQILLALAAAEQALVREPDLLPARFNQALALERLSLKAPATAAWESYLSRERDHRWAAEAREHLAAQAATAAEIDWGPNRAHLERAAANGNAGAILAALHRWPQQVRELAEEDALAGWADASRPSDQPPEARRWLAIARQLGAALGRQQGEHMTEEAVALIDRAWTLPLPAAAPLRAALSAGHRSYGAALTHLRDDDLEAAQRAFGRSRIFLDRAGSPFVLWADFHLALSAFRQSRFRQALPPLLALVARPESQRYPALRGRALWLLGLIRVIQGELTASMAAYSEALDCFRRLREDANQARLEALIADDLDFLGDAAEAWGMAAAALRDAARSGAPLAAYAACEGVAAMARDLGEPLVTRRFQDEVVRSARQIGKPAAVAEALRRRAPILAAAGHPDLARSDLEEAERQLVAVRDRRGRAGVEGDLLLAAGSLARERDPAAAVGPLSLALGFFRAAGDHEQLGRALAERARAYLALGNDRKTEGDFRAALAEIERQRRRISGAESRIGYLDQQRSVYERMVSFQIRQRHRPDLAFDYSERARARALLDWIAMSPAGASQPPADSTLPLTAEAVRCRLPAGTVVLELTVVEQRIFLWVVRRGDLHLLDTGASTAAATGLSRHLDVALRENRAGDFSDPASQLYDLLIRPAAPYLSASDSLVLVPEGPLATLPFGLLRDRRTGKYLIEEFALSLAPSATFFVRSLARDRELRLQPGSGSLFIGDPAFDRSLFGDLPRLPAAAGEARELAARSPGAVLLTGEQATRSAFLRAAGRSAIVHFGGHALLNPAYPLLSQLLFAPGPEDPGRGVLLSGQLLGRHFAATRLVVLAACNTAAGSNSHSEGVQSLARTFLASGVPAVIATLWRVDDQDAAVLLSRFYLHLRQGLGADEALRSAQLDLMTNGPGNTRRPTCWGAFELFGSAAAPLTCSAPSAPSLHTPRRERPAPTRLGSSGIVSG